MTRLVVFIKLGFLLMMIYSILGISQIIRALVVENSERKTDIELAIKLTDWSVSGNIQWKSFPFFTFVYPYENKLIIQ